LNNPESEVMRESEMGILTCFYILLREEMIVTIERLRYFYLITHKKEHGEICVPDGWGQPTKQMEYIWNSSVYLKGVLPILKRTQSEQLKVHPYYKKERALRLQINNKTKYDSLSIFDNILESPLFAKHILDKKWFNNRQLTDGVDLTLYIVEQLKVDSISSRRWLTILYNLNQPKPGLPKAPPAGTLDTILPATSKRSRRRTALYSPPDTSKFSKAKARPKKVRRTTRLDERWGYLPINIARGLEECAMGVKGETHASFDFAAPAKDLRHIPKVHTCSLTALMDEEEFPIPRKLEQFQTDVDIAKVDVEELLNLPDGEQEEDEIRESIVQDDEKTMYENWLTAAARCADLEADLMQYDSVTDIAWVPDNPTPTPAIRKGKLKGHYILRVNRTNPVKYEEVIPQNDWVEMNFKPEVLQTVQTAAYQKYEQLRGQDLVIGSGFFKIEGSGDGFVNVEGSGVGIKLDDEVINRLQFVKKKKTLFGPIYERDDDGKFVLDDKRNRIHLKREEKLVPAHWIGYSNQSEKAIQLETAWVVLNFDKRFLSQIKNGCKNKAAFVFVSPGDNRSHSEEAIKNLATGPKVNYVQTNNQRTCMVYSMASAVHYAGGKQLASEIRNMATRFEFKVGAFSCFLQFMERKHKSLKATRIKSTNFDLLERREESIILTCIRGADGKEDHCIAVYQEWIFDSNFPNALPLSTQSLDLCCSSDDKVTLFHSCTEVASFPFLFRCKTIKGGLH
jgi:hypothetical protein